MTEALKCVCIRCDKELHNYMIDDLQPDNGLAFYTRGHYGSTVFDPMDGSWLGIVVCDDCVKNYNFKVESR